MNPTARMAALLGRMRRERNGAVADAMRCYGTPCGLNYGVSLPTVRQYARALGTDEELARLLWLQDVRELRLAALHIADPQALTPENAAFWADGIRNSELAEEAAFALLSQAPQFDALFAQWVAAADPLLRYAALLGAARSAQRSEAWIGAAVNAAVEASGPGARFVVRGAIALLEAIGSQSETGRQAVMRAVSPLQASESANAALLCEELAWRLAETE